MNLKRLTEEDSKRSCTVAVWDNWRNVTQWRKHNFFQYFPYLISEGGGLFPNDFYDLGDVPILPNNVSNFFFNTDKNIIKIISRLIQTTRWYDSIMIRDALLFSKYRHPLQFFLQFCPSILFRVIKYYSRGWWVRVVTVFYWNSRQEVQLILKAMIMSQYIH